MRNIIRPSISLAWIVFGAGLIGAQPQTDKPVQRPLPNLEEFLAEIRQNLHSDRVLLSQYTYTEKNTLHRLDRHGNTKSTEERVYEVFPSREPDLTYRRLISKDGKPTDPRQLEKQDGQHNKKLEKFKRRLESQGERDRERRLRKEEEARKKEELAVDEMFRIYEIGMEGRQYDQGHPRIVLSFQPRSGYKPRTQEGKIMQKLSGRAWFSEEDHELAQIELRLIDSISVGWGLLARFSRGAEGMLKRQKINDEIWLPTELHFKGSARLFLVKGMRLEVHQQYSDFLKFTVESQVQFADGNPNQDPGPDPKK